MADVEQFPCGPAKSTCGVLHAPETNNTSIRAPSCRDYDCDAGLISSALPKVLRKAGEELIQRQIKSLTDAQ